MIYISILSVFLLFSTSDLQASFAGPSQKKDAENKPKTLRELRAQLATQKPTTLAAVVGGIAQMEQVSQAQQSNDSSKFSEAELAKMAVELSAEEAQDLELSQKTVLLNVIGKQIGGSVCFAGQSMADVSKLARLGYKEQSTFTRGQLVVVSQEKKCYYGLIVYKRDEHTYTVQVSGTETASVISGDIAAK